MEEVNYNKVSGELIKNARLAKNLTEEELAYKLDPDNCEKTIKLIKYWEKGNGFPDLNQTYKLAELLEINPNELFYYRQNGRKQFKENKPKKQLTPKQYAIKRFISNNIEDFFLLLPVLGSVFIFLLIFKIGPENIWPMLQRLSHFLGFM